MGADKSERTRRRQALADEIALIVLREGLDVLALRGLAERLETSARMLMYYFHTKEDLVTEAVDQVGRMLQVVLTRHGAGPRLPAGQFLANVLALAGDPEIAPFMRVLTELVARGARGETPYDRIARGLVESWVAWIDSRLEGPAQPGLAIMLLSIVEGVMLLDMASPGSARAAGPHLLQLFSAGPRDAR